MGPLVLRASAVPRRRLSAPIGIEGQDLEGGVAQALLAAGVISEEIYDRQGYISEKLASCFAN